MYINFFFTMLKITVVELAEAIISISWINYITSINQYCTHLLQNKIILISYEICF